MISSITSEAGLKTMGKVRVNSRDRQTRTISLKTPPGIFSNIYPEIVIIINVIEPYKHCPCSATV